MERERKIHENIQIHLHDQFLWSWQFQMYRARMQRKSNLNTVIPGYGMYTIYQTEENPKKAISSIQSVLKNKLRKTQEEIEKINASLEDLDEEMIQINADLLREKDLKK